MKKVVIFGGSGFIGQSLAKSLIKRNYDVVIISRNKPKLVNTCKFVSWNAETLDDWVKELENTYAIVNVVGRTVDCVKTPDNCDAILRSRVLSVQLIGQALKQIKTQPKVWVQMSTAHIYGDPAKAVCDENSPTGYGLAPEVGKAWENTFWNVVPESVRPVIFRTSFVIGNTGGAFKLLKKITRFGLGGTVGCGTQGFSWLHIDDMDALFIEAIENSSMNGIYVASAPNPVSNKEFMKQLRQSIKMPLGLPATKWMVWLACRLLLNTDHEIVVYGRYVKSTRLKDLGFQFAFPYLKDAINNLCKKETK
jgi:uncharacterized protein